MFLHISSKCTFLNGACYKNMMDLFKHDGYIEEQVSKNTIDMQYSAYIYQNDPL